MNEYEAFFYYGLRIMVALLGIALVSSLFITRLNDWTFILLGAMVIGIFGMVVINILRESQETEK